MKILLYSSYSAMPNSDILNLFDNPPKTCLFCTYADENAPTYVEKILKNLKKVFKNIVYLTPDYKFDEKIDCIFMAGGNIFELIFKLKKYNQFDKLKTMVKNGTLYIGDSAGSELCAKDNLFVADFEPPQIEMNIKENYQGFGFVDKKILVHASKYRYSHRWGLIFDKGGWHDYFCYKRKQKNALKIGNNAVAIVNDEGIKIKKYPWKKIVELNETKN